MDGLWVALLMGAVEGITEFLPVSSTGHLILTGHALAFTGPRADIFEVVIQAGAMLAVVGMYKHRLLRLLRPGVSGSALAGLSGIKMLFLTSAPALLLGLLAHRSIKEVLFKPTPVAVALMVGGLAMAWVDRGQRVARVENLDALTWQQALGVGLFQCLALWPGMSRSASTLVGGMLLGLSRKTAAEYSFLAALPIIGAATAHDLYKGISLQVLQAQDAPMFLVGMVTSAVCAWLAIKVFLGIISHHTLQPFAIYRVGLAVLVLGFPSAFGG